MTGEPLSCEQSTGKVKELLGTVQAKLGMTPNMVKNDGAIARGSGGLP